MKTISSKFTIISHPNLFKDDVYSISYRLILLHSLWYSYHHNEKTTNMAQVVSELMKIIKEGDKSIYLQKCLELYPFLKSGNNFGLVLIDRSKACYPLVFYPADDLPEHGNRISALQATLQDISRSQSFFDQVLRASEKWDTNLVNSLKEKFNNPTASQSFVVPKR